MGGFPLTDLTALARLIYPKIMLKVLFCLF